jgi:outer membrane lipoprotein-sorting protein
MKNPVPSILLITVILAVFQGSPDPVTGREPAAEDVVRNLQATFSLIEDYTVRIDIETDIQGVNIPRMEVKAFYKEPDKMHLESRGFAMLPREGVLINPNRFNGKDFYMSILGEEMVGTRETYKLELVPRREEIKVRKLILWIDPERWIILKIDSVTWQGQSMKVEFQYERFLERYWLPATAMATVNLASFKGFSSFHDGPDWDQARRTETEERKGTITIRFHDYRVNEGIPDSIFDQQAEKADID